MFLLYTRICVARAHERTPIRLFAPYASKNNAIPPLHTPCPCLACGSMSDLVARLPIVDKPLSTQYNQVIKRLGASDERAAAAGSG